MHKMNQMTNRPCAQTTYPEKKEIPKIPSIQMRKEKCIVSSGSHQPFYEAIKVFQFFT